MHIITGSTPSHCVEAVLSYSLPLSKLEQLFFLLLLD